MQKGFVMSAFVKDLPRFCTFLHTCYEKQYGTLVSVAKIKEKIIYTAVLKPIMNLRLVG